MTQTREERHINADPATWGSREIAEYTRKMIAQDAAKGKQDD